MLQTNEKMMSPEIKQNVDEVKPEKKLFPFTSKGSFE